MSSPEDILYLTELAEGRDGGEAFLEGIEGDREGNLILLLLGDFEEGGNSFFEGGVDPGKELLAAVADSNEGGSFNSFFFFSFSSSFEGGPVEGRVLTLVSGELPVHLLPTSGASKHIKLLHRPIIFSFPELGEEGEVVGVEGFGREVIGDDEGLVGAVEGGEESLGVAFFKGLSEEGEDILAGESFGSAGHFRSRPEILLIFFIFFGWRGFDGFLRGQFVDEGLVLEGSEEVLLGFEDGFGEGGASFEDFLLNSGVEGGLGVGLQDGLGHRQEVTQHVPPFGELHANPGRVPQNLICGLGGGEITRVVELVEGSRETSSDEIAGESDVPREVYEAVVVGRDEALDGGEINSIRGVEGDW